MVKKKIYHFLCLILKIFKFNLEMVVFQKGHCGEIFSLVTFKVRIRKGVFIKFSL